MSRLSFRPADPQYNQLRSRSTRTALPSYLHSLAHQLSCPTESPERKFTRASSPPISATVKSPFAVWSATIRRTRKHRRRILLSVNLSLPGPYRPCPASPIHTAATRHFHTTSRSKVGGKLLNVCGAKAIATISPWWPRVVLSLRCLPFFPHCRRDFSLWLDCGSSHR